MGQITSGIGLISGIPSKDIIDQLMTLEAQPKTLLQGRIDKVQAQKTAYSGIKTQVTDLRTIGLALERPSTFSAATAKSSDEDVLSATAASGAAIGSYQFQVASLVTSQQSITAGYANTTATVGAGNLTIEMGGGDLRSQTSLSQLNGGAGVRRGLFRITDRGGKTAVIDISSAVSLDDVVKKINTSLDISVKATISGDHLVLTDISGQTTSNLTVLDLADGHAAEDLGLTGSPAVDDTITGSDINFLGAATALSNLNDGRGVRTTSGTGDFRVTVGDGSNIDITVGSSQTVGDLINVINTAGGSKLKASLVAGSNGIRLTDTSGGGAFAVTALNSSKAASDLGLLKTGSGGVINGDSVIAGLDSVLISSLKGGAGLPLGQISIQDRNGGTATVNLAGATSVQEILDRINAASGASVTASLNTSGNGIQVADKSGGTGNLVIGDVNSTTAAALGIAGTFDTTKSAAIGANLQLQYISENSLLSSYNGGKGVTPGAFTITNSAGGSATVDLSTGTWNKLGDVITAINAKGIGVTASINANGDGLLLTDSAGGAGKLAVKDNGSTTAADLNIAGTATATTIDGSFEKTIAVADTDTLADVQGKIQALGFGVGASIVNDGSGGTPYRLSLTATNSGRAGRVVFDGGPTTLQAHTLVEAQDSAVFLGGNGGEQPLLVTSSKNQLAGIIPGVTIELHGVSSGPVQLNVARDPDSLVDQVKKFSDGFNAIVDKINDLTKYDTDKQQAGLLLGDDTVQTVQAKIYAAIQGVVTGAGRFHILADVGMTIGDGAKINFDEDKFRAAFAADPDAVKNLFAQASTSLAASTDLAQLNSGKGVRTASPGPDLRITVRDGSTFDVTIPSSGTVGDVLSAINTAGGGKVTAAIGANNLGLKLTDNSTTGSAQFFVALQNGSAAGTDLGITGAGSGGVIQGAPIFSASSATGGGIGSLIDRSLNDLVDPVSGVITRENQTLDDRTKQFQDRIDSLDKLLADKRARLERQFANMESVLAGLQNQQSALGSLGAVTTPSTSKASSTK